MFKKVLFPTDFSEYASQVLDYLTELGDFIDEVILVRVINLTRVKGVAAGVDINVWIEREEKISEEKLNKMVDYLKDHNIKAEYIKPVPAGDPVAEIVKVAKKENASLIIMGSRGRGIFKEILLGSVSEGVVRRSPVPVLVIKRRIVEGKLFDRILYAHDLSKHSECRYVKQAALAGGKEVVLLHVLENRTVMLDDIERRLNEIRWRLEKEGISVKLVIKSGAPYKEIVRTAKTENASLILMGSRGLGFIKGMLLGSTADAVLRHSEIPVLVYKEGDF